MVPGEHFGNSQKMCLLDEKRFNICLSKKKHLQLWIVSTQKREKKGRKNIRLFKGFLIDGVILFIKNGAKVEQISILFLYIYIKSIYYVRNSTGLKIQREQSRVGSIPTSGTSYFNGLGRTGLTRFFLHFLDCA